MTMLHAGIILSVVVFAISPASAEGLPSAITCTFSDGTAATRADGAFKKAIGSPLSFEIEAIDLEKQQASLLARPGAAAAGLRIVRALNANHFIEVLTEGFLGLTTVYDKEEGSGVYPAVHSRHVGVFGQAVVAHYTGTCKAKE